MERTLNKDPAVTTPDASSWCEVERQSQIERQMRQDLEARALSVVGIGGRTRQG